MRALMTAAAAALAMAAGGCVGATTPTAKEGADFARMKDACLIGASEELDTSRGLLTFAGDPVRTDSGAYYLDGKAENARNNISAFRCYYNEFGRYYAVKPQ